MSVVFVSDIVNPKTGLTGRQENLQVKHSIPIGALVEILEYDIHREVYYEDNGLRLYVCKHTRDCDGTPLYDLTFSTLKEFTNAVEIGRRSVVECDGMHYRGDVFIHGHVLTALSEGSLKVIQERSKHFFGE
jgi:hypothetical protein